ncbi:MAG TPA: hypothetical protein VFV89_06460 [Nocardioides sp.]|uniref:hypothetical protein n=1 Tax=Nocardioides sp. TaxID=35761 RepID=UPI002E3227AB|nr:hypothetical protein [Nocardioides sp.]HEX5087433.1 hypothetical protein [Nocardioides sp.]
MISMSTTSPRGVSQVRTTERWLAVLALLVTGGIHLALVPEHFEEATYAGWLFLVDGLAALALAAVLLVSDRRWVWVASGLVAGATVAAYVLSRTAGLPQLGDDVGSWTDPLSFPALAAEVTVVVVAISRLSGSASRRSRGR